jgi:ATP-binding cassette subfamily F protein 3
MTPEQGRTLLGAFLFHGDDAFKLIGALSGGQRSRIALARLAVQEANLLVLDEPTNHLDIASQEILQEVLQGFTGTLVLVSHDRYLVQGLADHIWVVEAGALHCLDGGWQEYLRWRTERAPAAEERQAREERHLQREAQRDARRVRKEIERLRGRQEEVEEEIHGLDRTLIELSERIGRAGEAKDMDQVHALAAEYRAAEKRLEGLWREWEELAGSLEAAG